MNNAATQFGAAVQTLLDGLQQQITAVRQAQTTQQQQTTAVQQAQMTQQQTINTLLGMQQQLQGSIYALQPWRTSLLNRIQDVKDKVEAAETSSKGALTSVAKIQDEIRQLDDAVSSITEQNEALSARLTALEESQRSTEPMISYAPDGAIVIRVNQGAKSTNSTRTVSQADTTEDRQSMLCMHGGLGSPLAEPGRPDAARLESVDSSATFGRSPPARPRLAPGRLGAPAAVDHLRAVSEELGNFVRNVAVRQSTEHDGERVLDRQAPKPKKRGFAGLTEQQMQLAGLNGDMLDFYIEDTPAPKRPRAASPAAGYREDEEMCDTNEPTAVLKKAGIDASRDVDAESDVIVVANRRSVVALEPTLPMFSRTVADNSPSKESIANQTAVAMDLLENVDGSSDAPSHVSATAASPMGINIATSVHPLNQPFSARRGSGSGSGSASRPQQSVFKTPALKSLPKTLSENHRVWGIGSENKENQTPANPADTATPIKFKEVRRSGRSRAPNPTKREDEVTPDEALVQAKGKREGTRSKVA